MRRCARGLRFSGRFVGFRRCSSLWMLFSGCASPRACRGCPDRPEQPPENPAIPAWQFFHTRRFRSLSGPSQIDAAQEMTQKDWVQGSCRD
eukprot:3955536-Pyramimonas_sp.AAC.1